MFSRHLNSFARPRDVLWLVATLLGTTASPLLPQRVDPTLAHVAYRAAPVLRPRAVAWLAGQIAYILHGASNATPDALLAAREHYAMKFELAFARVRARSGHYRRLETHVDGMEHLDDAMVTGRGAILWRMRLADATIANIALRRRGVGLVHLSEPGHGVMSNTWLARRVNSSFYLRAEVKTLDERVMIASPTSVGYLRTLLERLEQNRVVSMFGEQESLQAVTAPLFGQPVQFATGAPSIAWRTGAALIPLYVARESPLRYRVVLEPSLPLDSSSRKAAAAQAVSVFAAHLERAVRRHPAEWTGWWSLPGAGD